MQNDYLKHFLQQFITFVVPQGKSYLVIDSKNIPLVLKETSKNYDYIVLLSILEEASDIQSLLEQVHKLLKEDGRLVVIYRNFIYPYIQGLANSLIRKKCQEYNWLSTQDIRAFLRLAHFEPIVQQPLCFISRNIYILTSLLNQIFLYFFPFNHLAFLQYFVARKANVSLPKDQTVSIIIPARNEEGNISRLFEELPVLGSSCEVIFIEGHSQDKTKEKIEEMIIKYKLLLPFKFLLIDQGKGQGKADAMHQGFAKATNEILMIYDADMSVKAEDLRKFYMAIISYQGDLINGSRLVYPMQGAAMQFLNIFGNKFFSLLYSWILGQTVKDTLCGTKVIRRKHYLAFHKDRYLSNIYDPFGDFELLLGAAKLNLKIIDLPVRYYERVYGATNIKRFVNAWELFKFSLTAIKRLKIRRI